MGDFILSAKSRSGSRIVGLSPTRGSLAIVVDCQHLWRSLEKVGMLGSAAESAWIVSWKDQSLLPCYIHVSFRNLVCGFVKVLCILDGLECDFNFSQN